MYEGIFVAGKNKNKSCGIGEKVDPNLSFGSNPSTWLGWARLACTFVDFSVYYSDINAKEAPLDLPHPHAADALRDVLRYPHNRSQQTSRAHYPS